MAHNPGNAADKNLLEELFTGRIVDFNDGLQERLRGPEGAALRRAHLVEQFAQRLFKGDYGKAYLAMATQDPALGGVSPGEAAETHEGMLAVKNLIARKGNEKQRGLGALLDALQSARHNELCPLVDLLQAAWGLADQEFVYLLGVSPDWLESWRMGKVDISAEVAGRLRRLRQFHDALRKATHPLDYAKAWRGEWPPDGPLGKRSLWEAFQEDGDSALDVTETYLMTLLTN